MNPFLFSIVALCLATTSGAIAQYGSAQTGYQGQRKMSPSPQGYAASPMSHAGGYGAGQQFGQEMSSYEQQAPAQQQAYQAPQQQSYKSTSSAQVSTYDDRTPAASSYGRQQQSYAPAAPRQQYQQQQSSYAAPAASGYGKQAAKYEEQYHAPMPFAWGYDINDGYGGAQYHKETGDEYGKRTGSYGYTDAYGIYRQVDYVADENGFRATIKTNEPGTSNESPADVHMQAYEPPSNYYSGNNNNYPSNSGSSYGKSSGASSSYASSAPASSYGQQQRQSSSYGKQQQSYQTAAPARQMYHQQQEQQSYSSSAIVPSYSKAAAAAAPSRKY